MSIERLHLHKEPNTVLFRRFVENGSREAISIFFQNQADLFYRVAFKYTKNSADAEDVVQSSFLRIIDKANQYKGVKTDEEKLLQSWCLSIVIQSALMNSRTDSNRRKREDVTATKAKPFYEDENMDKNNEIKAVHQKVQSAILQLPEKYRIPIHLKYTEGFDLETIAHLLNLNINTLKSNIKRGLEKVSDQLKTDKITIASVGLAELIGSLPIEKAPLKIQDMASSFLEINKNSQRLITSTNVKSSYFSGKFLLFVLVSSIAIALGVVQFKKLKSIDVSNSFQTPELAGNELKEPVVVENLKITTDTNKTFLEYKIYDKDMKFLFGNLGFSEKVKAAHELNNLPIMISLPIKPQKKIFVVECLISPNADINNTDGIMSRGYWVKNNKLLKCDVWLPIKKYTVKEKYFTLQQIYFYENYMLAYVNGVCSQINQYDQNLEGANVALLINKFFFQKISSRTLEEVPKEILNEIENKKSLNKTIQKEGMIDGKNLIIYD